MIKTQIIIGANEEEYKALHKAMEFLTDLRNDIEEFNVPIDRQTLEAIENAESGLAYLWFDFGIEQSEY